MSFGKNEQHLLLQVVADSYERTDSYKDYYHVLYGKHLEIRERYYEAMKYGPESEKKYWEEQYKKSEESLPKPFYRSPEQIGLKENGACDPDDDPTPVLVDPLDKVIPDFTWKAGYMDYSDQSVEGNIYEKGGKYYVCFDGSNQLGDFAGVDLLGIAMGHFEGYLEKAYKFYKDAKKELRFSDKNVVFMGHSLGGAIASTLSAAIYLNAFDKDGKYKPVLFQNPDDKYTLGENISTITYNAPGMGWLFDKLEEVEVGDKIVFTRIPEERLKDVNVTSVGMEGDYVFNFRFNEENPEENQIGSNREILTKFDGKLPEYFKLLKEKYEDILIGDPPEEELVLPTFWHLMNTLELALHDPDRKDDNHERPQPGQAVTFRDPLIIDLNRDGKVSTTGHSRYFDLDANGIAEKAAWAASGDGLLAMDRDGDGKITSGRELFGDATKLADGRIASSGFQALAELDSNKDGIIDARDEDFGKLRVWHDKNGDGAFADDELFSLEEQGIESIDLSYMNQNITDENGNRIVRTGKVTWKDGDTSPINEFLLDRNTRQSEYEMLDVPIDIDKMPDFGGRGYLYSLQQAMVRDESGELKALVEAFVSQDDAKARFDLTDRIMLKLAEISDLQPSQHNGWLGFLDKYHGGIFVGDPSADGWRTLQSNYDSIKLYIYGKLLQQSHYKEELKLIDIGLDENGRFGLDIKNALEHIAKDYPSDPERTKAAMAEFFLVLKSTGLYESLHDNSIENSKRMLATYGADLVGICEASYLAMQSPVGTFMLPIFATNDGEVLDGDINNNIMVGGEKAEVLKGGYGSDMLIGGKGDDTLSGGNDSDIYIWNIGDGNDTILNSIMAGELDVLRIGEGVHPENVSLERKGNSILLHIGESGEVLTLAGGDWLNPNHQLSQVEFADGTVWNLEYMLGLVRNFNGTDAPETILASAGTDILRGGKGDDLLIGGFGSDTYVWNIGDGNDTILDERFNKDKNILELRGVASDSVEFVRNGNDLVLIIGESGERVTIQKWYNQNNIDQYRLHEIKFDDGTIWTPQNLESAQNEDITLTGTEENNILDGGAGNDTLIGGKGDDILRGGGGSDTYIWNLGDGNDTIFDGGNADILRFGDGIDASMLSFKRNGDNLLVVIGEEIITISDWEKPENHKIATIEFADGSHITAEQIDNILGDTIYGTDGDDEISGSWQHRTLAGGKGNDKLLGHKGGQTYLWNIGDGNDVIMNSALLSNHNMPIGDSSLKFGEGITPEGLLIRSLGDDLTITFKETGETITVDGWFLNGNNKLKEFLFDNGTSWNQAKIEQMRDRNIVGTDDNDTIVGYKSDDILIGGKRNDVLDGGDGNDTYIWNLGDGQDVITDVFGKNTLKFGENISPDEISVIRDGAALVISIGNDGKITLPEWFNRMNPDLAKVEFDDGTIWTSAELETKIDKTLLGTDDNDVIYGYEYDDVIIGGKGNDVMRGGKGSDTYIWNIGDGNDTIEDENKEQNHLKMGADVEPQFLNLRRDGNDLIIQSQISEENIRLSKWFLSPNNTDITFASGEIWDSTYINNNLDRWFVGTDGNDKIIGSNGDDLIRGGKGNDVLDGKGGIDTYFWNIGDGDDKIDDSYPNTPNFLQFGDGVSPDDLFVSRSGADIVLQIGENGEKITITKWLERKNCEIKFSDGTQWNVAGIGEHLNKIYEGTPGKDDMRGYEWNETFIGGKGDDTLIGGTGSDTYIWNLGDGNDSIYDLGQGDEVNILRFGDGIDPGKATTSWNGKDLIITIGETGERISIKSIREQPDARISIEFADGTVWNCDAIDPSTNTGSDGQDYLFGYGSMNETFIGRNGDDTLEGGAGSDTYIWNLGDGNDTIRDTARGDDINTIKFGEGVSPENIIVSNTEYDLVLTVGESGEKITVSGWRKTENKMLHRFEFADGTVWTANDIDSNIMRGSDKNDTIIAVSVII